MSEKPFVIEKIKPAYVNRFNDGTATLNGRHMWLIAEFTGPYAVQEATTWGEKNGFKIIPRDEFKATYGND